MFRTESRYNIQYFTDVNIFELQFPIMYLRSASRFRNDQLVEKVVYGNKRCSWV